MNPDLQKSFDSRPWQATLPSIAIDFRDEFNLVNTSSLLNRQAVSKKLTTEALFTICFLLLFVILTLIRSLISVYEYYQGSGKETYSSTIERKAKAKDGNKEEKNFHKTSSDTVFLTNLKKILDCFCIKSNAKKLFNTVSTQEQLSSINGIRGIIVIWVLIGHISIFYAMAVRPSGKLQSTLDLQVTQILKNTIFIVDAFLVLSGFLTGYLFFEYYEEKKGKISWLSFYVHRFVRLAPLYFTVLGFYSTLFPYLGSGPVWPTYTTNPVCRENWIWHVLFLQNFKTHMDQCLFPTWYLACDMQLYIISPIFLILFMRKPKIGYIITFLGICGSCFINFIITKQYELIDGPSRLAEHYSTDLNKFVRRVCDYFDILYSKPYSRLGTFLIGMTLGYYLFKKKATTIKTNNQVTLPLGWIMAAIFMWISFFGLYGREESTYETAVYNGLKHALFSISVAWIIFVSVTGQGGFVNRFLCNKIFIVISRLNYTIYLTHFLILEGYFLSMGDLIDHSVVSMISHILLLFPILATAFVVSLVFEAPIIRIIGLFFKETKKEVKTRKQE